MDTDTLASRSGLPLKRVIQIIRQGKPPNVTELYALAKGLNVMPKDLLSD